MPHLRLLAFGVIVALCLGLALWYGNRVVSKRAAEVSSIAIATTPARALPGVAASSAAGAAGARPVAVFRNTALGEAYGRISFQYTDDAAGTRHVGPLSCERVHVAAGRGICLEAKRGVVATFRALLFDQDFRVLHEVALAGPPSRARMSPDGRLAAMTVFLTGHSYASTTFTTRTSILDAQTGAVLVDDLEKLPVTRDGKRIQATDFNFWGVTFTRDGQRFFATLGTAGKQYLIEGDVAARQLRVVHDNVECPSLSPDERQIAFKRRRPIGADSRLTWGVHVLDLATRRETELREARNVDDQVEWNGVGEVAYAMPEQTSTGGSETNVWAVAVDGAAAPRMLLRLADSPTILQ